MQNRVPLIAGNWKMYKNCFEAEHTADELVKLVSDVKNIDIMIAPSFTSLALVNKKISGSNISLGAQNIFWEDEGAFTGEISKNMLISAGCTYVIIGHSERRQYFNETNKTVNKKIKTTLESKLKPVLCIGETELERESKKTFSVLDKQIKDGLQDFTLEDLDSLSIAYEPVWAIGTGKTATKEQAQEVHKFIRSLISKEFNTELASSMRIIYGGSVKPDNISELMNMTDIDGALVGGASLKSKSFSKIIKFE